MGLAGVMWLTEVFIAVQISCGCRFFSVCSAN